MKTLIVYATKTGFAAECVEKLAAMLPGDVDKINLSARTPAADPARYDSIIIGGSIHAGKLQKSVKKFCAFHAPLLATKKVGLFITCLTPPAEAMHYFDENFPASLVMQAATKGCFGGAAYYERMSPIERFIIRKISGVRESFVKPNDEGIKDFARAMK